MNNLNKYTLCLAIMPSLLWANVDPSQSGDKNNLTDKIDPSQSENKTQVADLPTLSLAIEGVHDEQLLNNIHAFLSIGKYHNQPIENPAYVRYLANSGTAEIAEALAPFGYYQAEIKEDLVENDKNWQLTYRIQLNHPTRVDNVAVKISGEGADLPAFERLVRQFPLKKGDTLDQPKYEKFKTELLTTASTYGFFDADYVEKAIRLAQNYETADIDIDYNSGQRYHYGDIAIEQDFLDEDVFLRFVDFKSGDAYDAAQIADLQRDLYNSNYVKMINTDAPPDKANKTVPLTLKITPKKNKKHTFAIGYGTDTGPRARYDFDWRWVNRRGHRLKSNVFVSQDKQNVGVEYLIPAKKPATDYYRFFANTARDVSGDKDSVLWNLGGSYHDQRGHLEREFGVKWQQENFKIGLDEGHSSLVTPFVIFTYKNVDDPLNINRGLLLKTTFTGAHKSLLSDTSFFQAIVESRYIHKLSAKHKLNFAAAAGKTFVDDFHQLPPAYRFFIGGDRTVRGYRFENIGQRDQSGANIGGDKMYFASVEYEYFFNDNMAGAVFVDAGDAYANETNGVKIGAGLGFHYYSPIGPIKIDVGHGFRKPGDKVRLHLTIGPAF